VEKRRAAPTIAAVAALAFMLWWFAGPRPSFVSDPGEVAWFGGVCLDLEIKQADTWLRVASADLDDAINRKWGPPREWATCNGRQTANTTLLIPSSFEPGLYRICDAATQQCLEARHAP
jgi:hypothetical protein